MLHIIKAETDGSTGHITLHVRALENLPHKSTGTLEVIGISHAALMRTYHGPSPNPPTPESMRAALMKWLAERHAVALEHKHALDHAASAVNKLRGQTLEFAESAKSSEFADKKAG